jgi:hypothetical protein
LGRQFGIDDDVEKSIGNEFCLVGSDVNIRIAGRKFNSSIVPLIWDFEKSIEGTIYTRDVIPLHDLINGAKAATCVLRHDHASAFIKDP